MSRNVDVGQTVAASLQAPTIFTIAQDLSKMQLYAKTDESEVGRIKVGQRVTFVVDAFPHDTFPGVVSQMRMNATIVQNVVTYDAIIDCDNPDGKLFPGMTAYVTIPVAVARNVIRVSNAALRYRPPFSPEMIRTAYAEAGIDTAAAVNASHAPADEPKRAVSSSGSTRPSREGTTTGVVWKKTGDQIVPVEIALGITDHAVTEVSSVLAGSLAPGDSVITGSLAASSSPALPDGQSTRR